jgi:hypothetical protein
MQQPDNHTLNVTKPEDVAYWSTILKVAPLHLISAVKATGSTLVNRLIYYLKAEGLVPFYFDINNLGINR